MFGNSANHDTYFVVGHVQYIAAALLAALLIWAFWTLTVRLRPGWKRGRSIAILAFVAGQALSLAPLALQNGGGAMADAGRVFLLGHLVMSAGAFLSYAAVIATLLALAAAVLFRLSGR